MKNALLFLFLNIFAISSVINAQKKPDWVTNPPISNDYFTGINFASKTSPDYIDQAKSKALKGLSSEIIVKINSETFLKTTEIDNEVKQSYENKIKTNVQQDIEGYETVDIWQDKNEYWIYYRLSKSSYYSLKRQKFEAAVKNSEDLFNKAKQSEASGNYAEAINAYLLSTKPIEPYLAETFDAALKTKSSELFNGTLSAINNIFANTKVIAQNKKVNIKTGEKINQELNVKTVCVIKGVEKSFSNLPLVYLTQKGEISLSSQKSISNDQGVCTTQLTGVVSGDNNATLKAMVDLPELLKENEDVLITRAILKKIAQYDLFTITISNPSIFFATDEKNLSNKLSINILEPALKDFLKQNGFSFVPNKANADFIVNISGDTRKGGQAFDLSVTFLDANITITSTKDNEQIYSKQFASIKGVKQDHVAAGNEAYRKVISSNFKNELFPELKEKFKINP